MRIISIIIIVAFLLSAYACVAGYNVPKSVEEKLPTPVTDADFYNNQGPKIEVVTLGQALFFDKILSGNQNISCATCHNVLTGTGDGLSLSIGEEGDGTAIFRIADSEENHAVDRVPRNAPPLFNLGAREFTHMFADGRVENNASFPSGVKTPAKMQLPEGVNSPLAAQALFPVTSATEMCGHPGENDISDYCANEDFPKIWFTLVERLKANQTYVALFKAAYPEIKSKDEITMVHAANAIADFEEAVFRADDSPFDRYLRGEKQAMTSSALAGMNTFYGKADCSKCHSGIFQTDQKFHAVAMPQLGPGKGDGFNNQDDYGRERVTGGSADRYKFRTPSLRNIALTGPWGHSGAINDLREAVIRTLDPVSALHSYDRSQAVLPSASSFTKADFAIMDNPDTVKQIAAANEIVPVQLSADEIDDLVSFLHALTDSRSLDLRSVAPMSVPSGIPLNN